MACVEAEASGTALNLRLKVLQPKAQGPTQSKAPGPVTGVNNNTKKKRSTFQLLNGVGGSRGIWDGAGNSSHFPRPSSFPHALDQ